MDTSSLVVLFVTFAVTSVISVGVGAYRLGWRSGYRQGFTDAP